MKRHALPLLAATALAALAACSPGTESPAADDKDAAGASGQPADPGTPVVSAEDPGVTNPDGYLPQDATVGAPIPTDGSIPAAMQGRWGLVAADCEAGRSDAKGLLEIGDTTLTYYESRGKLGKVAEADGNHLRAMFDFSGEGMAWQRDMLFTLRDGGNTLVNRQYGEDALAQPLTYRKCA